MLSSKSWWFAILGGVVFVGAVGMAKDDRELGLAGSKHDFVRLGVSYDQRCMPCHAPNSAAEESEGALWDDSPDSTRRYKLYGGSPGVPGSVSLVCLSCHDGSSAMDAFGGLDGEIDAAGIAGAIPVVGRDFDLSGDHPVGVTYPEFDRNFRMKTLVEGGGVVTLREGRVECVSCHDVHGQYGVPKFLVKSNLRSALCLTCHRK